MVARRARIGAAHAVVWVAWGAAAALIAEQPLPPSSLALGAAVAAVAAAVVMLMPERIVPRMGVTALALSTAAVVVSAVSSALTGTPQIVRRS